jgi:hypothetical protein
MKTRERDRRDDCRQRAIFYLYGHHDGRRTFEEVLSKIVRRWPMSARGKRFQNRLRKLWDRETKFCQGDRTP